MRRERVGHETKRLSDGMHKAIAEFYNNDPRFEENSAVEITKHFLSFHDEIIFKQRLRPYRSYWHVFDADSRLASTVDMTFYSKDKNKLYLFDFRRVKELKSTASNTMFTPIEHLPDNNYTHYSLQLNLHRYILEKAYNKSVEKMFIVLLHPELKGFRLCEPPNMHKEVMELVSRRIMRAPVIPLHLSPSTVEESPRGDSQRRDSPGVQRRTSFFFNFA